MEEVLDFKIANHLKNLLFRNIHGSTSPEIQILLLKIKRERTICSGIHWKVIAFQIIVAS